MAAVTPDTPFGTSISFSSGFLARITDMSLSGMERPAIDSTHYGSTAGGRTFIAGDMYDPGEMQVTMQFDTDASPPITGNAETVTITWPDLETWACSGFMTSFEVNPGDIDGIMEATATIKLTGSWTF